MAGPSFLFQLVYASVSRSPMSSAELGELLRTARRKNAERLITGVLLHQDGMFLQALEGTEAEVRGLFSTIERDSRHGQTTVLWQGNVAARSFGDWSMGFANATDPTLTTLEGYRDFFGKRSLAGLWSNPSRATELLKDFRGLPWRQALHDARTGKL